LEFINEEGIDIGNALWMGPEEVCATEEQVVVVEEVRCS
jgi:hypothetical protein